MKSHTPVRLKEILLIIDKTISVAESLTGGHLQARITSVSGSSDYFVGGVTAYNIDQKVRLLNVDRAHAAAVNCVSQRVAEEMAAGVRQLFGSFIGVATTGYAEPWPNGNVTTPFAFFAVNIGGWVTAGRIEPGDQPRVAVQEFVADGVMHELVDGFAQLARSEPAPNGLAEIQRLLRDGGMN
jgi:nicotinamide-nucleotide amidase